MQGDGNLQMGVGQYGKNSRATHVSRDKATKAVVYARGGPVPEPDENMRKHERVVAKPSPNASAIPRGVRGEERLRQVCSENEPESDRFK